MSTIKLLFCIILTISTFTAACTNQSFVDETDIPEIGTESSIEDVRPPIDVCEPLDVPGVAFPRQEYVDGSREVMEAELVGKLVLDQGCLRIESLYGDVSYFPIWPPGFTLDMEDGLPVILDENGNMVGQSEDEIFMYMGGGEASGRNFSECVQKQVPIDCDSPYWIVGEGVRPALRHDANLFNVETFSIDQRSVFLVSQNIVLNKWIIEPSTIEGTLVLPESTHIPRLQAKTRDLDFLLIWPQNYTVRFLENKFEIINGAGDVIAREGESIVFQGGPMPTPFDPDHFPEQYYDLPEDCIGPFWIIVE